MEQDSISTAAASAILTLLVGREVGIRGEFGGIKVADKRQTLTAGSITTRSSEERNDHGHDQVVVLRLEFDNAAVEMWDPTGPGFGFGPEGLSCSMGMGDVTITT